MRNRITIQTTEDLDGTLEEVRVATGRATKSDVIRDGLELYDLVVQHLIAGKHLYLGTARESAGEVLLPHLERAAGRLRPSAPARRETVPLSVVPAPAPADAVAKPSAPARATARRRSETP